MCSASDLLRKANGGEILRWLLLSKRIPPTDGKKYNTVPEREANCILFNALPIIRSASFNHLFRKEFMGATQTKAIAEQGVAMLQMLRDICGDINNLYISRNKGSILDAVVTIGQLCAEEGAREYFGLHFDVPSRIFSLINYRSIQLINCI
ncbi:hypothetical protein Ae201684_013701 [Aphanomyces euteiches]|uniref:Uncharacterized protein n=1 Tax=Aphanomyces euteiches TaxID=100861 RepID=A0A6G0WME5_9STRA|nr:hypothetical protein Ae201684_013701 [Aphanomyces euteiches]